MKILALEFSSSKRSVALLQDGVVSGYAEIAFGIATPALALVQQALKQGGSNIEELDRIAVGLGPGSYTGIRLALAIAQGFAMTRPFETVGVSSMLALAMDAPRLGVREGFHVVVDAQRKEFYRGDYEVSKGRISEAGPLRIVGEEVVRQLLKSGACILGPDLAEFFSEATALYPDARVVGSLASDAAIGSPAESLKPIYLRQTTFVKAPRI